MTKESGAGILGTSWAFTAASPGPPAHMGGAITQSVHSAGTLSSSADNKDGVLLPTQTTDHSMPSTDGELA